MSSFVSSSQRLLKSVLNKDDEDEGWEVCPPPPPEVVNQELQSNASHLQQQLRSINQAQSLPQNLATLMKAKSSDGLGGIGGLCQMLFTDRSKGIDIATIETRRSIFGANELPLSPRKSFWELFVETFDDATLQILIVAALVSLAIGMYDDPTTGYVEGCAILAAVLIVSIVTAMNDYQKESQFRQLSSVNTNEKDIVVIRNGTHWQIPITEVVVGDLVCMEAGSEVPCDGVLVHIDGGGGMSSATNKALSPSNKTGGGGGGPSGEKSPSSLRTPPSTDVDATLQIDESALTGESVDVDKDLQQDPFVLSGCTVEAGSCQFVAIAVGKESQWGIIQSHLEKEQDQTPLQEKLDDMAALIGYVGMAAAGATFVAMMAIKIILKPAYLEEYSIFGYALEAFIIGVTIVVVAVPEGLPLAVTISLAFSTKKMLADQNLIRHLAACETMGNATNICSDKTGTLTENRMTVIKGVFADTRCDDTIHRIPILISERSLHLILECISCCSTARIVPASSVIENTTRRALDGSDNESSDHDETAALTEDGVKDDRPHIIGNKTEAAMLLLAQSGWSYNDDTDKRREAAKFGKAGGSRLFPFSSRRKRMSVLVTKPEDDDKSSSWTLYHKGAAELVLASCSHYLDNDGSEKPMTPAKRAEYERLIEQFASEALRCVALAHRCDIQKIGGVDPKTISADDVQKKLERDMCLDGICGIMDPLRSDVIDAVATCQRAGIFVRMVTGDNLNTAEAIARQAGILKEGTLARCSIRSLWWK